MASRGNKISAGERALRMVKASEKASKGYKMAPTDLPKTFVEAPWNSWTFERTTISTATFEEQIVTVETIITQLATKLSLTAIERVRIKIHAGQIWAMPGTALVQPDLEARFFELSQGDQQIRSLQRDIGNWNKPAKAGYVYPTVDKSEIYNLTDKDRKVLSGTPVAIDSKVTCRVQLLWRSLPP